MKAMTAKMQYLNKRENVLAQNIANADTPGYQSKDLTKVDFGKVLKNITESKKIMMETTDPQHLPNLGALRRARDVDDRLTYEVSPDKNGVILEEQLVKASETQMDYNLITNLLSKQTAMYKVAIGRQS